MRIHELVGAKSVTTNRQHLHQIVSYLMARGFSVVGSGAFSDVLLPPNRDYVLKLFMKADHPYLSFIKHVTANHTHACGDGRCVSPTG